RAARSERDPRRGIEFSAASRARSVRFPGLLRRAVADPVLSIRIATALAERFGMLAGTPPRILAVRSKPMKYAVDCGLIAKAPKIRWSSFGCWGMRPWSNMFGNFELLDSSANSSPGSSTGRATANRLPDAGEDLHGIALLEVERDIELQRFANLFREP